MKKVKLLLAAVTLLCSVGSWAQALFNHTYTEGVEVTAGEGFFLYNIGTGQFLTSGLNYGTRATVDNSGRVLTLETNNSGFSIYTNFVSLNNRDEGTRKAGYLTTNGYVDTGTNDAAWVFTPVNLDGYTNAYTIKNSDTQYLFFDANNTDPGCPVNVGNNTGDNYSYWLLIPKAARENAGDYSHYLINTQMNSAWEYKTWGGSTGWNDNAVVTPGGLVTNRCGEKYHTVKDIYQDVKETVPNGLYRLSAQGFYRQDDNQVQDAPVLYVNSSKNPIVVKEGTENSMNDASTSFTEGKYPNSVSGIVTNGSLRVGINITGGNQWVIFDNFVLDYLGTCLVNDAVALPDNGDMVANTWYYFDINAAADDYNATASSLDDIICTDDGSQLTASATGNVTLKATENSLKAIRYYVKSSSTNNLKIAAASYTYTVGSAIADKEYIQPGNTVTISYADLITNDPDATLTKNFNSVTFAGEAIKVSATDNGFSFVVPTTVAVGAACTLAIPAGAIGYAAGSTYNAAQEITLTTPAVFDGFYFLRAPDGRYVGRGSSYNTRAIIEAYGLPLNVTTNANGITNFKFADSNQYLFDAGNGTVYTDNTSNRNWAVEITEGGYYIINKNNNGSPDKKLGTDGGTWMQSNDNGLVWTIEPVSEHNTQMEALKDAQAAAAAVAAGNNEITTKAALASWLDTNYAAVPIEVDAVSFTEKWHSNATAGDAYAGNGVDFYTNTVENLKPGLYKLTVNAYYRLNSQATTAGGARGNVYLYANDVKTQLFAVHDFPAKTPWVSGNDQSDELGYYPNNVAAGTAAMNAGNYLNELYLYVNADEESETGHITYGIHQPSRFSNYQWCGFQNFTLTYYTNEVSDDDVTTLIASIPTAAMAKSDKDAIASAKEALEAGATIVNFKALSSAIENAALSIAQYETYNYYVQAVKANNEEAAASVETMYNEGTIESIEALIAEFRKNLFASLAKDPLTDYTAVIVNPGFETGPFLTSGNVTGWEVATDGREAFASNSNNSRKFTPGYVGSSLFNTWTNVSVAENSYILKQNFGVLPAGMYRLTGYIASAENNVFTVNVGNGSADVTTSASTVGTLATVDFTSDGTTASAFEIASSLWFKADDFHLTFVPNDVAYTLVEGKMNSDVAVAQTAAETAFKGTKTYTNYAALVDAIAAAQASKDAYTAADAALKKANDILNSTNIYTTEARTTYADAIAAAQAAYDENSMDDATANGLNAALNTASWGAAQTLGAAYIGSAWTGTNIGYNFWSSEGDGEGASGMSTPFIQYWVADAEKLADNTITASVTGLENGNYIVTAFVRAMNKKTGEGETGYDGISLQVNDGRAVAFAEATEYSDGYAKVLTAEGLVKDGNLNIKFNVEGTNVSWLAIKNVNYTKDRDLNPEEMAVVPTAIALFNGKDEVTEAIELDATTQTVTLTPSYQPANASEDFIEWETSDASVATIENGVVTAVSSGTATITVTSTLAPSVFATATINVSFPETDVPASYYVNNNATRTVYTLGENLIKNGSFEYPDGFYGWTDATAGTAKLSSSKFEIVTDGETKYLKAKASEGSTASGSIGTAWSIESGKTYVFGYRVKANQTIGDKSKYHKVTLTNSPGAETLQVSNDNTPVTNAWTDVQYTFTNTDGYAFVQFRARWLANDMSFDDFYLAEVTSTTEGNVDYATAAIPTENIGEGAFQYSQDAIDAANALVQGEAKVEDVEAAYEAVTTLNVPEETQAYNLVFNCDGHKADGNALTLIPNPQQTQGLYGLQYLAPANENLAQAFYFVHTTGNKYKVYAIDNDLNQRYITTQAEGYGTTWYEGIRTIDDASKAMEIEIRPNGEGLYLFWNTGANKPMAHNGSTNIDLFTNNTANFQFIKTSKPSIEINTTTAGWGTVILPFAVAELPTSVKAYSVNNHTEKDQYELYLEEVTALKANKPYIIEGAWEDVLSDDAQGAALSYTEGWLTGTYVKIAAPNESYILQKHDDTVGFYKVDTKVAQPNVPANRAYLTPGNAGGVKAFYLSGTEDAIKSVFDAVANGDIYDLNGRKVQKMQKGNAYIVNGKKVIVK